MERRSNNGDGEQPDRLVVQTASPVTITIEGSKIIIERVEKKDKPDDGELRLAPDPDRWKPRF
jgi:hypothetical protein